MTAYSLFLAYEDTAGHTDQKAEEWTFLVLRALAMLGGMVALLLVPIRSEHQPQVISLAEAFAIYEAGLLLALWRWPSKLRILPLASISVDLVFVALFIWYSGGTESHFSLWFYLLIALIAVHFAPAIGLATAVGASLSYTLVWLIDPSGNWHHLSARIAICFLLGGALAYLSQRERLARARAEALNATLREHQVRLENAYARRTETEDQLRHVSMELAHAEERERRRQAEVLHDGLQQLLVAAELRSIGLERHADTAVQASARQLHHLLHQAITASRSLTLELSPPALQAGGLIPALEWLACWMAETHRLGIELHTGPVPAADREPVKILLFQAVRELLFNVSKYAGVQRARVDLAQTDDEIRIAVSDQGRGFDPAQVKAASNGGLGLPSIRQRLEFLGGKLEVPSRPGQGCRFTLPVPVRTSS